jgi:hypothetical protein
VRLARLGALLALSGACSARPGASPTPASEEAGGATCAEGRRCPSETPYCIVSSGVARCAAESEVLQRQHDGRSAALRCAQASDCARGERCCATPLWDGTHCAAACDPANSGQVCADDADCAAVAGAHSCRAPSTLDAPALPRWLRVCSAP